MKTKVSYLNRQPKIRFITLFFLILFQTGNYSVYGQKDTLSVKLIGGGEGNTSDENKRIFYNLELNFDLVVTPLYQTNDQQVVYKIADFTGSTHLLSTVEDNWRATSFGYNIAQDFITKSTDVGILNYSVKENCLKNIEFVFPSKNSSESYLKKIIFENDTVKAYYYLSPIGICLIEVPATASLEGIFLQIIETAKTKNVKYVGYTNKKYLFDNIQNKPIIAPSSLTFPVFNTPKGRYALINKFDKDVMLSSDFDDVIYLYDENKKLLGHMYYEYEYKLNKDQVRNAILILHNDNDINQPDGAIFPYNMNNKEKFPGWRYYNIGESPVSMLIPPLNKFPEEHDKSPILLLHGLTGKYNYAKWKYIPFGSGILADPSGEDISYWYTTPRILNNNFNFHAWQLYYPDNDAAVTIAECLKFDLSFLKTIYQRKINLVTHSYGGIITGHLLMTNSNAAKSLLEKVLFITPPFYGSFAASRDYDNITFTGTMASLFDGADSRGLCYRDASLCSKVIMNFFDKPMPSLNENSDVFDDYFVIMGSSSKNYITEHIHEEAKNHSDGLVSMSSASLLNKNIGFATLPGNHDDGIHAQSNHPGQQNLGTPYLIPSIIHSYFSNNYETFVGDISKYSQIQAIVNYNEKVLKPDNMTLSNLKTSSDENYQKCLLNFEILSISQDNLPDKFYAYYNRNEKELRLNINPPNNFNFVDCIGEFWKNRITHRYYFHGNISNFNPTKLDNGCATDLLEGMNKISLSLSGILYSLNQTIDINYCQSHFLTFDHNEINNTLGQFNGNSSIKDEYLILQSNKSGSIGNAEIYVDNQASQTTFLLSSQQARKNSFNANLMQPNGEIYKKTSWQKDTVSGLYSVKVDNPMPGVWQIVTKDTTLISDKLFYEVQGLFQSKLILYDANEKQIDVKDNYKSNSIFVLPDKNKLSDIKMKATITSPLGKKSEVDFGLSKVPNDSGYVFSFPLNQDITGIYSVSVECTGTYNGNKFERYYSSQIKVIDNTPRLAIPDIYLDGLSTYKEINLNEQIYCLSCNTDDFIFSSNFLGNNDISVQIDSTSMAFISSSFKDTTTAIVEFVAKSGNQVICRDTVLVHKNLPDLTILNLKVSDTTFVAKKNISISLDIVNNGNSYTNNFGKVGVFLSKDFIFDKSDIMISDLELPILSPQDTVHFAKDFPVPGGISLQYAYLLVVADVDSLIFETNKLNNIISREINFIPQTTFKISVLVNKDTGELIFTEPNSFSTSSVSYNGYDVGTISWWNDYNIWAYASGSTLPLWVNYQYSIDNYENLDSVKISFLARGTSNAGVYYSYLYLQINNYLFSDANNQLIDDADWVTYAIKLPKNYFNDGLNEVKVGTSASSQTYVALRGIAVEFNYKQNTVVVNTDSPDQVNAKNIKVYPNPANNVLFIDGLNENTEFAMYDINGKLLIIKKISNNQFDISHLRPGIYFIKVKISGSSETKKFIKN